MHIGNAPIIRIVVGQVVKLDIDRWGGHCKIVSNQAVIAKFYNLEWSEFRVDICN